MRFGLAISVAITAVAILAWIPMADNIIVIYDVIWQ